MYGIELDLDITAQHTSQDCWDWVHLYQGVGQAHVHYKALTKIFLWNIIVPSVVSNKSYNNGSIVIICYC